MKKISRPFGVGQKFDQPFAVDQKISPTLLGSGKNIGPPSGVGLKIDRLFSDTREARIFKLVYWLKKTALHEVENNDARKN